jgi:hypothetical protein
MIRLSRWQTFFIGFGIIVALFLGERLLFLHKAVEVPVNGNVQATRGRRGVSKFQFLYNNEVYTFTSYGFVALSESNGTLLIDPDNPEKAYINAAAEIWVPRGVGHLLALIVWYMVVSSFITNREFVRLSLKGISREKDNPKNNGTAYNSKQLNRGK